MTTDLEELRGISRADVYKGGHLAARLTRTPHGVRFDYLPSWLDDVRPAVATTLPLSRTSVLRPGGALPAYFAGLLPEGRRLSALRRQVKTSADDELSLLMAVGAEAIGNVQVVPEGVDPADVRPRVEVGEQSAVSFADVLAELDVRPERTALPGVQDKVSAAVLSLPPSQRGTRYILKLSPPEYPHLVENEACFLRAAGLSGLRVASASVVHDRAGVSGLLVERFDRRAMGGQHPPRALALEDACQVLGHPLTST